MANYRVAQRVKTTSGYDVLNNNTPFDVLTAKNISVSGANLVIDTDLTSEAFMNTEFTLAFTVPADIANVTGSIIVNGTTYAFDWTCLTLLKQIPGQSALVRISNRTCLYYNTASLTSQEVSNPNLLDNWYFTDPVNQRGLTEYTSVGYTIDRWLKYGSSAQTVTITDDCIRIKSLGSWQGIIQKIDKHFLAGTPITVSALIRNSSNITNVNYILATAKRKIEDDDTKAFAIFGITSATVLSNGEVLLSKTAIIPEDIELIQIVAACQNSGEHTSDYIAAKLELGTRQTLARQDSTGKWVLNDPPPNKAVELLKCQRYQYVFDEIIYASTRIYVSSDHSDYILRLPLTMRKGGKFVGEIDYQNLLGGSIPAQKYIYYIFPDQLDVTVYSSNNDQNRIRIGKGSLIDANL